MWTTGVLWYFMECLFFLQPPLRRPIKYEVVLRVSVNNLRSDYSILRLLLQLTFWKSLLIGKGVGTRSWLAEYTTIVSRDTMFKRPSCTFTPHDFILLCYIYIILPRNNIKAIFTLSQLIYWNIKTQAKWKKLYSRVQLCSVLVFFSLLTPWHWW